MNSDIKTEVYNLYCIGCGEYTDKLDDFNGVDLCDECNEIYDNITGYCSLECCLGGGCDESC